MRLITPKVSVVTITFNQEAYIAEALNSILSQKTDFEFEVIVADDCSSDGTPRIIKEFVAKYPNIVKPILRKKNIGAYQNFRDALQQVKGRYLAMCEGDDFWTNNYKLQRQVDFLDSNSDHSVCFHPVRAFFEGGEQPDYIIPDKSKKNFTTKELLEDNFIQTNSVVYKAQDYSNLPEYIMPADWYMHLFHTQFGKIGFINEIMSAYRRHQSSLWWEAQINKDNFWKKNWKNYLQLYSEFLKMLHESKYQKTIYSTASRVFKELTDISKKGEQGLLIDATVEYPFLATKYILLQRALLDETNDVLEAHKTELAEIQHMVALKETHIKNLEIELAKFRNSKIHKIAKKLKPRS